MFPDLSTPTGAAWAGLTGSLSPAIMDRLVLLLNHVLSREPAAQERLKPHAGALIEASLTPAGPILPLPLPLPLALPALPPLRLRVTAAGLLEREHSNDGAAPALRVQIDGSQPMAVLRAVLAGQAPKAQIDGDAQLAADVDWLAAHVRWDVMDDLQAAVGPSAAQLLTLLGVAMRSALERVRGTSGFERHGS